MPLNLPQPVKLSIISPFYNEEGAITQYFEHVLPVLKSICTDFEIICIDDGSRDATYAELKEWAVQETRIKTICFSRNFGKEAAISAGLDLCSGEAVIPLDADLQDPPKLMKKMFDLWEGSQGTAEPINVVLPIRSFRKDPLLKRWTADIFYHLFNHLARSPIPAQAPDFRLMDRKVVNAVCQLREKNRFMRGLLAWPGFRVHRIPYTRPERQFGTTKYNYRKMFEYALDGIFGFSVKPLKLFSAFGLLVFIGGIILMGKTFIDYYSGRAITGYTTILLVVLFLNGINLLGIGILGEYIARIYTEVKDRPMYVIQETCNIDPPLS